jgi:hypothetical protein
MRQLPLLIAVVLMFLVCAKKFPPPKPKPKFNEAQDMFSYYAREACQKAYQNLRKKPKYNLKLRCDLFAEIAEDSNYLQDQLKEETEMGHQEMVDLANSPNHYWTLRQHLRTAAEKVVAPEKITEKEIRDHLHPLIEWSINVATRQKTNKHTPSPMEKRRGGGFSGGIDGLNDYSTLSPEARRTLRKFGVNAPPMSEEEEAEIDAGNDDDEDEEIVSDDQSDEL